MPGRIVIVGGGFAGLYAARELSGSDAEVVVVDRRNHHLFQPLLYQVATAALEPASISQPIRRVLAGAPNVSVLLAEVRSIDAQDRRVLLEGGELGYDALILAPGVRHHYFGHAAWEAHAPGLKTLEDALEIRRRILLAFEEAEREEDPARREAWLTFVVVGGGPTGVELAGALVEIAGYSLARDFRRIDPRQARVVLVEAGPRLLPSFDPALAADAARRLRARGVEVLEGAAVTAIGEGAIELAGRKLEAKTVLWAAGVAASPLGAALGGPLDKAGRVLVGPDLSAPGHAEVFIAGDLAAFLHEGGKPLPGTAPVAIQMGRHAARNALRLLQGLPGEPFRFRDRGSMATIGRNAAIAELGPLRLKGLPAWLAWVVVHIFFLIGFRNRLIVMIEWAWSYATFARGARVLLSGGSVKP